jgi:hypothetical protein
METYKIIALMGIGVCLINLIFAIQERNISGICGWAASICYATALVTAK